MEKVAPIVLALLSAIVAVYGADPELLQDYAANPAQIDASFFTFTGFRNDVNVTAPAGQFLVKKASVAEFPGVGGLGVSYARLSFQGGSVNPPHTHPRGTELLYVIDGSLTVGLVDSTNKLFVQKLMKGDVFAFPKGLIHFQINEGMYETKAISAFSSSNAGTISIPTNIFGTNIDDAVLSKAFKVAPQIIRQLKQALTPKWK